MMLVYDEVASTEMIVIDIFYPKGARTPDSLFFTKSLATWRKYLMSIP